MEPKDIKALGPSTFDFAETPTPKRKKASLLQKKRRLVQVAGLQAERLSNADIMKLAAALLR